MHARACTLNSRRIVITNTFRGGMEDSFDTVRTRKVGRAILTRYLDFTIGWSWVENIINDLGGIHHNFFFNTIVGLAPFINIEQTKMEQLDFCQFIRTVITEAKFKISFTVNDVIIL